MVQVSLCGRSPSINYMGPVQEEPNRSAPKILAQLKRL